MTELISIYHGTTLENAIKILEERKIKGNKKFKHHQNSYVSFSKNKVKTLTFGEIIFEFKETPSKFITVPYDDFDWMMSNQEMSEYISETDMKETLEEGGILRFGDEDELFLKTSYDFDLDDVTVHICLEDFGYIPLVENKLRSLFKDKLKIVCDELLFEEWTEKGIAYIELNPSQYYVDRLKSVLQGIEGAKINPRLFEILQSEVKDNAG